VVLRKDGRQRQDALLDAALSCFTRAGILGVGIEEIRREAGASPSSVYHLFSDRNDIILALLVRTFERLLTHLDRSTARVKSARGFVQTLVQAHVEWILSHRDEGRFMYQATAIELAPGAADRLLARKAELLAPIAQRMQPFVERGELPRWSPLVFDVVVLGPSHEALRRFLGGAPLDPRFLKRELPRLAWKTIDPGRPTRKNRRAR
jgi:AcrR family transcriptional regulator